MDESITGAKLDPVDGMPVFGKFEGELMSRPRYLEAAGKAEKVSRKQAQQEIVEGLREGLKDTNAGADPAGWNDPKGTTP